jgi:hypothetical protein
LPTLLRGWSIAVAKACPTIDRLKIHIGDRIEGTVPVAMVGLTLKFYCEEESHETHYASGVEHLPIDTGIYCRQ